jgi:glycosyltransferase involved in cell wall biosynthesis
MLPDLAEVTVVDGGSTDTTAYVATALGAKVIVQKGTGKGDALRQAFEGDHAGDILVTMDADGSNRPEEVPQLIAAIVNGADIAKGSRFLKGGGSTDLGFVRKIGNKFFLSIVNHAWSGEYTDLCYGFMAFRRDALHKLLPSLESAHFQIETEICIKARKLGLKVVEIPSVELKRRYGSSKLRGFQDSLSIAKVTLAELLSGLRPSDKP